MIGLSRHSLSLRLLLRPRGRPRVHLVVVLELWLDEFETHRLLLIAVEVAHKDRREGRAALTVVGCPLAMLAAAFCTSELGGSRFLYVKYFDNPNIGRPYLPMHTESRTCWQVLVALSVLLVVTHIAVPGALLTCQNRGMVRVPLTRQRKVNQK